MNSLHSNAPQSSGEPYPVMGLYDGALVEQERLLYPASAEQAIANQEQLLDRLDKLRRAGGHVAIVDGAFDVPHDNHTWYLRESRRRAAARHFGDAYTGATPVTQRAMVASNAVHLLVTLDADHKIAEKKNLSQRRAI